VPLCDTASLSSHKTHTIFLKDTSLYYEGNTKDDDLRLQVRINRVCFASL
jgi:hypothetical protein